MSWDNNEIEIEVALSVYRLCNGAAYLTTTCNETRRSFLAALLGAYGMYSEKKAGELAHQAIGWWFASQRLRAQESRDEKLEEKLARIVFVAVTAATSHDGGITCRDRITTFHAPSKPL